MRPWFRLWMILWVVLVGGLSSCGPLQSLGRREAPALDQAAPGRPAVLGVEEAGPLPEYHLTLSLDVAERRLVGRQQVTIPNRSDQDLEEIVFRLYPNLPRYGGLMGIGPVWVDGQRGTSSLRAGDTSLVIPLTEPLPPRSSVTISLTFDIEIPNHTEGYVLFGHSQGIWSLPDAYPLLAVHDSSVGLGGSGSTWHEDLAPLQGDAVFADAALYEVTLTVPPTLTVAATGSVLGDTLNQDGADSGSGYHGSESARTYHIAGGPWREFAWLASADYLVGQTTAGGTVVRTYYLPGDEAAGLAALSTAAAALRVYADAYGAYPFAEMAVAEAPLEHYGMEYPGLNLIGQDLYRERRAELENRLAHEIAHQWWYAQVGNDQVNVPWLDEGLAEYSIALYYRQVYGQARANTLINQRWLVPYQGAVENGYDAVLNQPSAAFGKEYEVIVYAKAALFFEELRQKLGDDTYQAVLREYVDRYRWRIATPDDFLRVAESVSGQDLDSLYSFWVLGKQ